MGRFFRPLIRQWFPAFIGIAVFLVVLAGYLYPITLSLPYRDRLEVQLHELLIDWAVIVAACAVFLGLFNIVRVHLPRVRRLRQGGIYSLAFLAAMLVSLVLSLGGSGSEGSRLLFDYLISPVGAAMMALVAFTLAMAALRLLRAQPSLSTVILFIPAVIVLLLSSPQIVGLEAIGLSVIRDWIVNVLGMAGVRGLLLGVTLGTVMTALRVLWPRGDS